MVGTQGKEKGAWGRWVNVETQMKGLEPSGEKFKRRHGQGDPRAENRAVRGEESRCSPLLPYADTLFGC